MYMYTVHVVPKIESTYNYTAFCEVLNCQTIMGGEENRIGMKQLQPSCLIGATPIGGMLETIMIFKIWGQFVKKVMDCVFWTENVLVYMALEPAPSFIIIF